MKKRNFLKSHHASIYKRSQYKNPFFSHKKEKSFFKKYLLIPLSFFILIITIWILLIMPWFKISTIDIQGLVTIYPNSIEQHTRNFIQKPIFKILPGNHIWLVNIDKLEKSLKNEYQLKSIEISQSGRTITINASERITRAVWVTNNKMYFLDVDGVAIRELTDEEQLEVESQINTQEAPLKTLQSAVFTIWDLENHEINLEEQIISSNIISTVNKFNELLKDSSIQPISYIIDNYDEVWLTVNTTLGIKIYINGEGDAKKQFDNLQLILSEYQDAIHEFQYIDLRFGNRVYIK